MQLPSLTDCTNGGGLVSLLWFAHLLCVGTLKFDNLVPSLCSRLWPPQVGPGSAQYPTTVQRLAQLPFGNH